MQQDKPSVVQTWTIPGNNTKNLMLLPDLGTDVTKSLLKTWTIPGNGAKNLVREIVNNTFSQLS